MNNKEYETVVHSIDLLMKLLIKKGVITSAEATEVALGSLDFIGEKVINNE